MTNEMNGDEETTAVLDYETMAALVFGADDETESEKEAA